MDYLTTVQVQNLKIGQAVYLPVVIYGNIDDIIANVESISKDEFGTYGVKFKELSRTILLNGEEKLFKTIKE